MRGHLKGGLNFHELEGMGHSGGGAPLSESAYFDQGN